MDNEAFLTRELIELPERVERLEKTVFEQRFLIGLLLGRSGLDEHKVDDAFELAARSCKEIIEKRVEQAAQEWANTAEGQQTSQNAAEALEARRKELWREDCLEAGCIKSYVDRHDLDEA